METVAIAPALSMAVALVGTETEVLLAHAFKKVRGCRKLLGRLVQGLIDNNFQKLTTTRCSV